MKSLSLQVKNRAVVVENIRPLFREEVLPMPALKKPAKLLLLNGRGNGTSVCLREPNATSRRPRQVTTERVKTRSATQADVG